MKHPTPEQLAAFHDGTASASTIVAVEEHLNTCAECHEALAALDRQDRALMATLSHDPGDAYFEVLASRIEARLGEEPQGAADPSPRTGFAPGAWLAGYWRGLRSFRAPEWAGALAALVIGLGLVLLNVKHGTAPTLRDRALEQRAGQAAQGGKSTDEARAPETFSLQGREAARDDAQRVAPPARREPAGAAQVAPPPGPGVPSAHAPSPGAPSDGPPSADAMRKQEAPSSRAYRAQSTPTGENQPPPRQGFAKAPAATPGGQAAKPRPAPVEESPPKVEREAAPLPEAKQADRAPRQNEAGPTAATKPAAPAPTATLPPEPEMSRAPAGGAESGARPTAALTSEPQGTKLRYESSGSRACGTVKDSRGRPIPSASVTLVNQGSGVSSDTQGRFCIEAPPGDQTLSVMAVGFAPLRIDVHVAPDAPPLSLTLVAISVIEGSNALRGNARYLAGHAQSGAPSAPDAALAAFPDSLQAVAGRAVRATLEADRTKSATRYESAAVEWERVLERSTDPALDIEARFRIAEARFRAWGLTPTAKRVALANEALTSYLVRAPLGARRDTASAWLGRVKP